MSALRAARRLVPQFIVAAGGAAAAVLLDPVSGSRRRRVAIDRMGAMARRSRQTVERAARATASEAYGTAIRATHLRGVERPQPPTPEALADRVRSIVFRDPEIPKGDVNISVERGDVVVIRGHVTRPAQARELAGRVASVPGVGGVDNQLQVGGARRGEHAEANRRVTESADQAAERELSEVRGDPGRGGTGR